MLKTLRYNILLACCLTIATTAKAQIDSLSAVPIEQEQPLVVVADSLDGFLDAVSVKKVKKKRDWASWRPETKRAMWLSLVLPGAGQIYNRKYWKLPIIYGGFVGCVYAMRWNNMMYHDYSQAYMDLMDDDPNTKSYESFLHLGNTINVDNPDQLQTWQNKFKKRKDYYRRYRDMSVFILIGVYALSVIDAYVDASLSEFDISDDITLRVEPAIMNDRSSGNPLKSSALGLQCSISF